VSHHAAAQQSRADIKTTKTKRYNLAEENDAYTSLWLAREALVSNLEGALA